MRIQMKCEKTHGRHVVKLIPEINYSPHVAKFWCITCNKYLAWSGIDHFRYYKQKKYIGVQLTPFLEEYYQLFGNIKHKPVIPKNEIRVDLSVTYKEKEIAKSHGAKWDPVNRHWYTHTGNSNLDKLFKYIDEKDYDNIYNHFLTYGNNHVYINKCENKS